MTARDNSLKFEAAPPAPSIDTLLGAQVGEFIVEERIGSGGMGVVYRATHPLIGKQVAIKVLRAEFVSQQQVERLLIEARAVNAIRHPGIIDIFGFGTLPDGRPYIIMELLRGDSLSAFIRRHGRLDVDTTVWILDQMMGALGAAHRTGIVHRDLKPGNVFLAEPLDGGPRSVKLVDFGIAKLVRSHDGPTTLEGSTLGTPEFMAPEQIRGEEVSAATDLYAVGVMAFQMLTGARPFQGEPFQILFAHVEHPPPVPSSRVPSIPPELDTLVLHLLAKDPALRPESAEAVRQALRRAPSPMAPPGRPSPTGRPEEPEAKTVSHRRPTPPRPVRGRWGWAVGASALAGLGGTSVYLFAQRTPVEVHAVVDSPPTPSLQVAAAPVLPTPVAEEQAQPPPDIEMEAATSDSWLLLAPAAVVVVPVTPGSKPKLLATGKPRASRSRVKDEPLTLTTPGAFEGVSIQTLDEVLAQRARASAPATASTAVAFPPVEHASSTPPVQIAATKSAVETPPSSPPVQLAPATPATFLPRTGETAANRSLLTWVYKLEADYLAKAKESGPQPEIKTSLIQVHQQAQRSDTTNESREVVRTLKELQQRLLAAPPEDERLKKDLSDLQARLTLGKNVLSQRAGNHAVPPAALKELARLQEQLTRVWKMTGAERFNFREQLSKWESTYVNSPDVAQPP